MATPSTSGKGSALSKAEYLKRYLGDSDGKQSENKKTKKKRIKRVGKGMKIVDDDVDWKQLVNIDEKENQEDEDEEEAPVVAEVIDERPKEIKCLEEFRTSNKWRVLGATNEDSQDSQEPHGSCSLPSTEASSQWNTKALKASSTATSTKRCRHDSLDDSPTKKMRHDSPDLSPVRRCRSRSLSSSPRQRSHNSSHSGLQKQHRKGSPSRRKPRDAHPVRKSHNSDSDLSPPRDTNNHSSGSDLSPPRKQPQQRKRKDSDSDLSPPRRKKQAAQRSDGDLSPSRRASPRSSDTQMGSRMLSGGTAGLVSVDVLRREREDNRRHEKKNLPIEDESRNAQTVFRDKSGKKRDIELEREEQRKKAEEKAERDKKYFEWGKGLAQGQMQQQNVQDALKEAQKPLARHIDDEDLDRMLREQEREGDPMAGMLRKKKEKDLERKGLKERPCYKGPPPPPNRFNIMPGYRWDGVDRSNGFEKKRYSRFADNKAVQEMAYKWSVEDM